MKKLMFYVVFLFLVVLSVNSQNSKSYAYCELVGTPNLLSSKISVEIDLGQKVGFFQTSFIRDENGKRVKFNSMIDAMNSMGAKGWEFVQAYVVTTVTSSYTSNVYHYVLKKEVTVDELKSINSAEEAK
jgi:hypothetical protein